MSEITVIAANISPDLPYMGNESVKILFSSSVPGLRISSKSLMFSPSIDFMVGKSPLSNFSPLDLYKLIFRISSIFNSIGFPSSLSMKLKISKNSLFTRILDISPLSKMRIPDEITFNNIFNQ